MRTKIVAAAAVLVVGLCGTALAQDAPSTAAPRQERSGRGMGVGGQITAIEGTTLTLQTFRGESAKVKITPSTRIVKGRDEAKLSDLKVGYRIFVRGQQDKDGVWIAEVVRSAAEAGGMVFAGVQADIRVKPEDNGKSYILGVVTKIDGTKLTIKKPDNAEQVIEVDDDTSFRNARRESVTLIDVKIGDLVRGQGEVKNGVFVPKELIAGRPRGPRSGIPVPPNGTPQRQNQAAPDSAAPASAAPAPAAQDSDGQKE